MKRAKLKTMLMEIWRMIPAMVNLMEAHYGAFWHFANRNGKGRSRRSRRSRSCISSRFKAKATQGQFIVIIITNRSISASVRVG